MSNQISNNKRIAKNTIVLYIRTILVLLITLYTSRVILNMLGVHDYGLYNVVGGVVTMFSVISGSISASISRFITFELGVGDFQKLRKIFSSSLTLLIFVALIVLILGEIVGVWFINNYLSIPPGRLGAAQWVFQFSLFSFAINFIGLAFESSIRAHERMTIFAYVGIIGALMKLLICYMLIYSPCDRLVYYGFLMFLVTFLTIIINYIYCVKKFKECRSFRLSLDTKQLKSLSIFAGWTSVMHGTYILNTQGINILMNMFFGVTVNAARGIAQSIESAIMNFVNNFLSAVYPQITKLYAAEKIFEMHKLVCRGSKFAFFLLLILALPVFIETESILKLWLGIVPEHTVAFFRLTIASSALSAIGNAGNCACQSTEKIKGFSMMMSIVTVSVFPITYVCYILGFPVESSYIAYILVYSTLLFIRMYYMKKLIGLDIKYYARSVLYPIVFVTISSSIIPVCLYLKMDSSIWRFLIICVSCFLCTSISILFFGMIKEERVFIINSFLKKFIRKNEKKSSCTDDLTSKIGNR